MDNLFVRNRLKLLNIFHEGDFAILFAGEAPQKRGDEKYRFSPDRNFYYLSGIDRERCILVIAKIKGCIIERLYIEESNGQMAKWVGENITKEYAQEISAINDVRFLKEFEIDFEANKKNIDRLFLDGERKDLLQNQMPEGYKQKYKISQFEDLFPILTDFRLVKEPEELNLMKEAMEITRLAIEEMMKNAKPNMKEYEIEAYYDFILTKNGVRDKAFQTIAAS
ncbi:MAG: aminopeptidase P N-terminal domain-containing protein, partial [Anaerotignaceae bacterium]